MDQFKVVIQYHTGKRRGQIITIEGIEPDDIIEILGEITQSQLAHTEIQVHIKQKILCYEEFLIDYYYERMQLVSKSDLS